ncbi:MAG: SDR family NAD(P)-dependent oxidoreductase [Bacteroidales bacterium]|nr:SDR family NAD(P)-dependent oxidoreductase [Bacteroidales bacterium]
MNKKIILFTGGTSGLGRAAVKQLAVNGATVLLTNRDATKGQKLIEEVVNENPGLKGSIELITCDFNSLESVKKACGKIKERVSKLDALVNNAGTWNFEFTETEDDIENTLQVNLLVPALFIYELKELLQKSGSPKVINTASALHQGGLNLDDLEFREKFSGFKAYRQSKLGIILLTRLYQKKFEHLGISFYSQHPGLVNTGLVRKGGWVAKQFFKIFGKSPRKGAKTLLHLLETPSTELKGGEYYKNCKASKTSTSASYSIESALMLDNACRKMIDIKSD